MRTFIAIPIEATPPLKHLREDLLELGRPLRPEAVENWHITLKFLGDTDDQALPDICRILSETAAEYEEFLIELRGLGAFPHLRRPSVVWVGVETDDPLVEVANVLEDRLSGLGFSREKRKFHPHLTVARVGGRSPRELATYVTGNEDTDYGSGIVDVAQLYQSVLTPQGARYTVLSSAVLRQG